jgi:hypothetical protein
MICVVDKSDTRKLIVNINFGNKINLSIMLKDAKLAFNTKNRLEQVKMDIIRH